MNEQQASPLRVLKTFSACAVAAAIALGLQACTSEAMYNAIRENRLQACEEIPIPQQESCKAQYQVDYETYRRDRDAR